MPALTWGMTSADASAAQAGQAAEQAGDSGTDPVYKIPESVLVVIYRDDGQVLLLRRTVPAPEGLDF